MLRPAADRVNHIYAAVLTANEYGGSKGNTRIVCLYRTLLGNRFGHFELSVP